MQGLTLSCADTIKNAGRASVLRFFLSFRACTFSCHSEGAKRPWESTHNPILCHSERVKRAWESIPAAPNNFLTMKKTGVSKSVLFDTPVYALTIRPFSLFCKCFCRNFPQLYRLRLLTSLKGGLLSKSTPIDNSTLWCACIFFQKVYNETN